MGVREKRQLSLTFGAWQKLDRAAVQTAATQMADKSARAALETAGSFLRNTDILSAVTPMTQPILQNK